MNRQLSERSEPLHAGTGQTASARATSLQRSSRQIPVGAESDGRCVNFRVWSPGHHEVRVVIGKATWPLDAEGNGYFSTAVSDIGAGTLYAFRSMGSRTCTPTLRHVSNRSAPTVLRK